AEAQRGERNLHLGAPADLRYARLHGPGGVPVQVEAALAAGQELPLPLARHLSVEFDAGGIRAEHIAILPVEQAVYENPEAVRVVERRVPAAVRRDDG